MTRQLMGPLHFNWKGGRQGYHRQLRPQIVARDTETCFFCKNAENRLEIHHMDENPLNNVIGNLRLTCRPCHNKVHGKIKNIIQSGYKPKRKLPKIHCGHCDNHFQPRHSGTRFCSMVCKNGFHKRFMQLLTESKMRNSTGHFLPHSHA